MRHTELHCDILEVQQISNNENKKTTRGGGQPAGGVSQPGGLGQSAGGVSQLGGVSRGREGVSQLGGSAKMGQQNEYSLHSRQYASCVHTGGLSSVIIFLPTASEGWGKVMFSVCPHLGGTPARSRWGGTAARFYWGYP